MVSVPVRYPSSAANLWRWVDAPEADDAVASHLAEVEPDTLLVYVQRCALAAIRTGDPAHIDRACAALSALTADGVEDDRDVVMVATLVIHAALSVGAIVSLTDPDPEVAELVDDLLADGVDLVDDVGYRELDTPFGRVFVEDESGPFAPDADLVAVAYAVAAMLEADRYEVESVGIGQTLHPIWVLDTLNPEATAATGRVTGCVHVSAGGGGCSTSVFVAEAASVEEAAAIGTAADSVDSPRHPQLGLSVGRLCAILYAGTFDPATPLDEDKSTLDRFRPALQSILAAAAVR